jgi:enamine deaminase RidA (YjgF/YER057c/UK114 family)
MKLRTINAPDAPQPVGGYAQAVEVSAASRLLFVSGQVPVDVDGAVPADFESQARLCFRNIVAQLAAAGMTLDNLVQLRVYLARESDVGDYRRIRNEVLAGRQVASTTVKGGVFGQVWLLEVEATAAA